MPIQIVIDTNVFVTALRSSVGASFKLLTLIGDDAPFHINVSVPLVLEYEDVANRQRHVNGMSARDIRDILDYLCSVAGRRQIHFLWRPFLKDSQDDMVLELAIAAQCRSIISFNQKDFAGVEEFGLQVLSPAEVLKEIGEDNEHT